MFNLDPIPIPEWTWLGLWNYIQNHTDYFIILLIIALNLLAILWYFLSTLVMHALKRKRDAKSHAVREETEDILSQFIGDEENMDHYARECKRVFDNNPSNRHELFDVSSPS